MANGCGVTQCDDIKQVKVEINELKKTVGKLENITERQEKDITELKTNHAETKVYVKQILDSIDKLENKIFTYLSQITSAQEKDEDEDRKERITTTTQWLEFAKFLVAATIALVIGYIFGKGGQAPPAP